MRKFKSNKVTGSDNIPGVVLKLIEEENLDIVIQISNERYESGEIPKDCLLSTFITISKKPTSKNGKISEKFV